MRVRDVAGFEGQYAVTDCGQVISVFRAFLDARGHIHKRRSKILTGKIDRKGYRQVTLCSANRQTYALVHRLVASAFCAPYAGETVNHIDGDQLNNHHSNLEWCSALANLAHGKLLKKGIRISAATIDEILAEARNAANLQ